ncbi:hypothetical protein [Mycobacterium sp. 1274756.6]|uniref:hypothetical protein n=1 Tax=Mycobacterium sp. 1274756.6 TaxID=1834076 RepID=UPI0007FC3F57|nr:hypothetical protein [Mycobacterium sp. 1274756.6]OBJ69969.1 hypothetical protein A5643_11425 [Mycobacterium sp. 1274756.6]
MGRSGKRVVGTPRSGATLSLRRVMIALFSIAVLIVASVGIVATASAGQSSNAIAIGLVAGAFFFAAAFC